MKVGLLSRALRRAGSWFFALLLAFFAIGANTARADTSFDLLRNVCYAATDQGVTSVASAKNLGYRCDGDRISTGKWLWLRMEAPSAAATEAGEWSFLLSQTRFDRAELLIERKSGQIERVLLDKRNLASSWVPGNMLRIVIPPSSSPIKTLYFGMAGLPDAKLLQRAALVTEGAFNDWARQWLLLGGIFVGALTACLLYNLILLRGVRHRLQIVYLAWMSATLAYGLSWSGLSHFLAPGLVGASAARFIYFSSGMMLAFGVLFFIEFFREGQLPRWLVIIQSWLAAALMATASLGIFDELGIFAFTDALTRPLIVTTQLLTVYGIIRAMEREPGPAALYGLGWSLPCIIVLNNLLWGHGFIGPNVAVDAGIYIAIVAQALLLSAAAALRLGGIRVERDRARAESERLRSLAETDPLTAILNRRGLVHRAQAIMAINPGSAVILIDVDYFKTINDKFGHETGDRVLIRVSEMLRQQCDSKHPVGRIGGEEFAIVLGSGEEEEALRFADRVRRHLAGANFADLLGAGWGVTISIGLAVAPSDVPATFERLYVAADRALYAAKNGGRNRVEIASADDIRRAEARLATVI